MIKFILLSSQRTGSGLMQESLSSNPQIHCFGEVLIGYGGLYKGMPPPLLTSNRRARTFWQALFSGGLLFPAWTIRNHFSTEYADAIGMRIMYNQLARNPFAMRYLANLEQYKIIHLQRRNLLKKYVSHILMHRMLEFNRQKAHLKEKVPIVNIEIDIDHAIRYFESETKIKETTITKLDNVPILDVFYEDMIKNGTISDLTARSISSFLEVQNTRYEANLVKTNPNNLSDFVSNYRDVEKRISGTKWASFLS